MKALPILGLLIGLLLGSSLEQAKLRHALNAERRARCTAELALERARRPAPRVHEVESGAPDAPCAALAALRGGQ